MNKTTVIAFVAIAAVIGGILFVQANRTEDSSEGASVLETLDLNPSATDREPANGDTSEESVPEQVENGYQGELIAGNGELVLLDFLQSDYDKAKAEGKNIVHYFYATWCPICVNEIKNATIPAFNKAEVNNTVAFIINYNDSETTSEERAIASEFGVSSQHTKVFVVDGDVTVKDPQSWREEMYIDELENI